MCVSVYKTRCEDRKKWQHVKEKFSPLATGTSASDNGIRDYRIKQLSRSHRMPAVAKQAASTEDGAANSEGAISGGGVQGEGMYVFICNRSAMKLCGPIDLRPSAPFAGGFAGSLNVAISSLFFFCVVCND